MENLQDSLQEACIRERDLKVQLAEYGNDLNSKSSFSSFAKEADIVSQESDPSYPLKEMEEAKAKSMSNSKMRPLI